MSFKQLLVVWNDFWFAPVSPVSICLFRIFYGFLLLMYGLSWIMVLLCYTGKSILFSQETLSLWQQTAIYKPSLFTWLPADANAMSVWLLVYMLSACCVMLGFFTRTNIMLSWIILISVQNSYGMLANGSDRVLAIFGIPMMLAPAGAMLSLDSKLRKSASAHMVYLPWAQRLLQLHIAAIYWQAFWSKLNSYVWWDGTAVYYPIHINQFRHLLTLYLLDHLWICRILSWGTLLIELSLWSLIWFKEFRYWVLLAGVILHCGIGLCMYTFPYELIMIMSYVNFIYPDDLERWLANAKKQLLSCLCKLSK